MIKQISVFMENRSGRLNHLLKILTDHNINICSLSIADTGEYGIARLIVDAHEKAMQAIKENGMSACDTDVMAIEVDNTPGSLYAATKLLADNDINVEYAYSALPANGGNKATIIIRVDDQPKALQVIDASSHANVVQKL
jgi:hypothetical protein